MTKPVAIETSDVVSFADLDLLDQSEAVIADAELVLASVVELRERIAGAQIDFESRIDIRADVLEAAERLHAFALIAIGAAA